ncbi:hypothetical protein ACFQ3B_14705 [Stackebrandtia endophytica]|nr:hypothetical protein [Stackebrandtia endophytica]
MRRVPAVAAGVLVAGVLLSACGGGESDESSEIDSINDAVNNAMKLEMELQGVTNRLIVDCMVDAGFDTHPQDLTEDPGSWMADEDYQPLVGSEPPGSYDIPTLEEAKKRGFDIGRYNDPDFDWEAEDEENGYTTTEDPFWEMNEKYIEEYEKARYGEEYYDKMWSDEAPSYSEEEEEWPAEAGCTGEANAAIAEATGAKEDELGWPDFLDDWEAQLARYQTEALLDAQDDWSACVEERGHPYFEFTDGWVDLWSYVHMFYDNGDDYMVAEDGDEGPTYDPPPGAPWEFDEAYAKEVEMAIDVAECADETGLRKTMETEWNKTMEAVALENKDAIFAWHDSLEKALEAAQAVLSE